MYHACDVDHYCLITCACVIDTNTSVGTIPSLRATFSLWAFYTQPSSCV